MEFVCSFASFPRFVSNLFSSCFASQVSLVFITSDLLATGTVNMATVLVFVLTSCYYVVLARRRVQVANEEGEVPEHFSPARFAHTHTSTMAYVHGLSINVICFSFFRPHVFVPDFAFRVGLVFVFDVDFRDYVFVVVLVKKVVP